MTEAYINRKQQIYKYYDEQIGMMEKELENETKRWNKKLQLLTKELNEMKEEFTGFIREQEILTNNTK